MCMKWMGKYAAFPIFLGTHDIGLRDLAMVQTIWILVVLRSFTFPSCCWLCG